MFIEPSNHATRAIIHLANLRHNLRIVRKIVSHDRRICLCVKADAYGHGAQEVAKVAAEEGVEWLAVATVAEALALRTSGVQSSILLLSLPLPDHIDSLLEHNISSVVADLSLIEEFETRAKKLNKEAEVHLKIDTGMGRIGCATREALDLACRIDESSFLNLEGVCTHLPLADGTDITYTNAQLADFSGCIAALKDKGIKAGIVHAANSAGIVGFPSSWFDMVRPGIIAYGYYPSPREQNRRLLKPVMELVSKLVFLKQVAPDTPISYGHRYRTDAATAIGTVAAGYGDGYSRLLSNKAYVTIRGKNYPVVGTVCMDQFMVDMGALPKVNLYEDVVLFGPEAPSMTANEVADLMGTIPYEVTCNIGSRVPRVFTD